MLWRLVCTLRRMEKLWLPTGRGKSHCLARNIRRTDTSLLSRNYWLNRQRRLYLVFRYCLQPYSVAKRIAASNSARWLLLSHRLAARGRSAPFEMSDGRAAPNSAAASLFHALPLPCYAVARGSENAGTPSWLILWPLARTASERPPVAAGLFQVLALKCLSVYHLTIRPFNSLNSTALAKH